MAARLIRPSTKPGLLRCSPARIGHLSVISSLTCSACALHCGLSLRPPQRVNVNNRNHLTELVFSRLFFYACSWVNFLDKGIIKQPKIHGPTYNKMPPLETMGGVFAHMGILRRTLYGQGGIVLSMALSRALLDILSRGSCISSTLDILSRSDGFGEQPQQAFSGHFVGTKIAGVATPALLAGSA